MRRLSSRASNKFRRVPPPSSVLSFTWYSGLDLNISPFPGFEASVAPNVLTSVNVDTWAAFETACLAGSRVINVTGNISGVGNPVSGSCTDLDIVVNPGVLINSPIFGRFGQGDTLTRCRIRGPNLGMYSGGQVHNMRFFTLCDSLHIDGIGSTGGGSNKEVAIELVMADHNHVAITNNRGHCGNSFFLGGSRNFIAAGNSVQAGADLAPVSPDDEAWIFRCTDGRQPVIVFDNDLSSPRFHKVRYHPGENVTRGKMWVYGNTFYDPVQARIFWCGSRVGADVSGRIEEVYFQNNIVYAEDNSAEFTPDIRVLNTDLSRIQNNTCYGDIDAGDIYNTPAVTDAVVSGNVFNPASTFVWSRVGDPTGLDWTP